MLAAILQPINEGVGKPQLPVFTFKAFIDSVYLPVYRGKWKTSTAMTEEERVQVHLVGSLGTELMSKITRDDLQALLEKKAKVLARGGVDHLRFRLRSVFALAISEGVVDRNPAVSLFTPRICKGGREKLILTPEDISKLMSVLELRERLIVRFATFEGMAWRDSRLTSRRYRREFRLGAASTLQGQYRCAEDASFDEAGGPLGCHGRTARPLGRAGAGD
jgi:hypothetical protein